MARTSLAAVRSLGRQGLKVTVGEQGRFPLSAFSRYCYGRVRYASPERDTSAFVDWLSSHLKRERYEVAMPVDQHTFYLFSKNKEALSSSTTIPVADFQSFKQAYDKALTFRLAESAGIPCPKTDCFTTQAQVEAFAGQAVFPLVIKPRIGSGSRGVTYVRNAEELIRQWQVINQEQPRPLVQEYIPPGGDALGVSLLFNKDSEPRAIFVHKRLREYPLSGGPSTLRESVARTDVVELAVRLLRAMNWYGIAMVEFKVDPRDGIPKLMEVNPKLWGSLSLAIASGIDFPALLYHIAVNGDIAPVLDYRVGVRGRFLPADALHFLANPNRFRLKPSFFQFGDSNTHGDIWDPDDPGPALGFLFALIWRGWRPTMLRHVFRRSRPAPEAIQTVDSGSLEPSTS
jgi:predicted ATP-grasp superfamily ATP-dependent carboligase